MAKRHLEKLCEYIAGKSFPTFRPGWWWRLGLVAVMLLLTVVAAWPQETPGVIKSKVEQIYVPVSVSTSDGNPVEDLQRKDFHILEDGMEQEIANLAKEQVPLNVVFLMDISHSTFLDLGAIKKAIRAFVKDLGGDDHVALITFNSEARLILDWSNDQNRLERALERIAPKGSTVWYDALYVTYKDLLPPVKGKKVIVSVTDGWDTGSLVSFQDVLKEVGGSDAQIYIVSQTAGIKDYVDYFRREYGLQYDETRLMQVMYSCDSQLRKLSFETGGRVIYAEGSNQLDEIYKKLVRELRMQYYLSYTPHNILRDGQYRKITVQVDRMGAMVHHRPGYYAR